MDEAQLRQEILALVARYAEMVYYGYWFAPEREMLQVAIDEAQKNVTGTARLKLYKGNVTVVGRKSAKTLYNPQIATAPKPPQPIEKGLPGPSLMAYVATSKLADHLPLYRLERIFARQGVEISRSTMCA